MEQRDDFYRAVQDYYYLLVRNYPQKTMLKMVGDKYKLPAHQRTMLYRGICTQAQWRKRSEKKALTVPENAVLSIDGFNVIRVVGSYLNGNFVFYGMDGWLRDVSELHRKKLNNEILSRAVSLVIGFIQQINVREAHFYFDTPVSHSGFMAQLVGEKLEISGIKGHAETTYAPDHVLKEVTSGYVCTGDSNIIEESSVTVFDLASATLQHNFHTAIYSLEACRNRIMKD